MYSWRVVRIACSILLVLPVIHLTFLLSRSTLDTLDSSPRAWSREINAYASADARSILPSNPVVVVGGHRVKLWSGLEDILAPREVLMRGLGNAIVEDITHHYSRLIGYYQPDTVVLLPGDSEFRIRDNKSAEEFLEACQELVEEDLAYGITRKFYIFVPLKTVRYPGLNDEIDKSARLLEAWARNIEQVEILNANRLLADRHGMPKPHYFRPNGTQLNEHGYVRLSVLLETQLEADTPILDIQ